MIPAVSSCMYSVPGTVPLVAASLSIREAGLRAPTPKTLKLHIQAIKDQLGASYPIEPLELEFPASWDPVRGQLTAFTDLALLNIAVSGPADPAERRSRSVELSKRVYRALHAPGRPS